MTVSEKSDRTVGSKCGGIIGVCRKHPAASSLVILNVLILLTAAIVTKITIVVSEELAVDPSTLATDIPGPSPYYFPRSVGAKWTYLVDGKQEYEEVTAVQRNADACIVTVRRRDQFGQITESTLEVSESGLVRLTGGGPSIHPPRQLLTLPADPGQSWTWETYLGFFFLPQSTLKAFAPELIEVPAGRFTAIRVETPYYTNTGTEQLVKYWYAPGVGLVKYQSGTWTRELQQFESAD